MSRPGMKPLVILDRLEEEYLVRIGEAFVQVRNIRQLFLWTQGQMQALLPHHLMVCIQFDETDGVVCVDPVDRHARDPTFTRNLCHPQHGLAVRLARLARSRNALPYVLPANGDRTDPLESIGIEVRDLGLEGAMIHGTERFRGGASCFILFGMPGAPDAREMFFFELLLPLLHVAFQRVQADSGRPSASSDAVDLLSARELEILTWVMRGKSNFEISAILDLSTLTVKNHLQNIYRKLNVHTRVQAVARCWDLHALGLPGAREPG
jgi:transcriptional regulator EpsA